MAVDYTPQWRERAEAVPTAGNLRQFDLRTAPDRLQAYCDALDRRVEVLEAEVAALRQRLHRLELVEVAE